MPQRAFALGGAFNLSEEEEEYLKSLGIEYKRRKEFSSDDLDEYLRGTERDVGRLTDERLADVAAFDYFATQYANVTQTALAKISSGEALMNAEDIVRAKRYLKADTTSFDPESFDIKTLNREIKRV